MQVGLCVGRLVSSPVEAGPDWTGLEGPPATLRARVLDAVRSDAVRSDAVRSGTVRNGSVSTDAVATDAFWSESDSDRAVRLTTHAAPSTPVAPFPDQPAPRPVAWFRRLRVRLAIAAVAATAAVGAILSTFGSAPVLAATVTLWPNPASPSPKATGTADFFAVRKGAPIDKVTMKLHGLSPNAAHTFYECWLVGNGDSAATPQRIAVGRFRTGNGDASLRWKATAYSGDFRRVDISLESDDGNPAYGGVTVLTTVSYSGKRTG